MITIVHFFERYMYDDAMGYEEDDEVSACGKMVPGNVAYFCNVLDPKNVTCEQCQGVIVQRMVKQMIEDR